MSEPITLRVGVCQCKGKDSINGVLQGKLIRLRRHAFRFKEVRINPNKSQIPQLVSKGCHLFLDHHYDEFSLTVMRSDVKKYVTFRKYLRAPEGRKDVLREWAARVLAIHCKKQARGPFDKWISIKPVRFWEQICDLFR